MQFLRGLVGSGDRNVPEGHQEMISIVVLYQDYVELTLESLREILDDVFPGAFLPPGDINFVVDGAVPGATFMIKCAVQGAAGLFMLHNVPGPYTEFSDFVQYIADPALRASAEAQSAWLSIDLIVQSTNAEDAYRFIGKVLARLAPGDAAFLVQPETNGVLLFDESVRRDLAEGRQLFSDR